jgi:hypothetical protein
MPPQDEGLERLRDERDHLRVQISLLENAQSPDQNRLRQLRQQLAQVERAFLPRVQPTPAKNVGDNSPNPLPDDQGQRGGEGGGDAGRSS